MKKMLIVATTLAAFAAHAATYYTTGSVWPDSGGSWNTAADGTGAAGFSSTYKAPSNDLVVQSAHTLGFTDPTPLDFGGGSYTLEAGSTMMVRHSATSTFNGGDWTALGDINFRSDNAAGVGVASGNLIGTAKIQLGANTLSIAHQWGSTSGIVNMGLGVVGNGTIDFLWMNAGNEWNLSNLSSEFTGTILLDSFSGVLSLGNGAPGASVVLADSNTRTGQLNMDSNYSVGALSIENEAIAAGTYTHAQLLTIGTTAGKDFSDNLIDNGGSITVIPEPATMGLFALAGTALFFSRRMKMV